MNTQCATVCGMLVLAACSGSLRGSQAGSSDVAATTKPFRLSACGLHIVPNAGQWSDETIRYAFRTSGLNVAFRDSAITMQAPQPLESAGDSELCAPAIEERSERGDFAALDIAVRFPGAKVVTPHGANRASAKFNYFIGEDQARWVREAPSFAGVVYPGLYDGVDLHVRGSDDGVLKYEFHVAPGAAWRQIRVAYEGIESLHIDSSGSLQIQTARGTLRDAAPIAWQEVDGQRRAVRARFELLGAYEYRIAIDGGVDPHHELVIDPDLEWMTYLGASGDDEGWAIGTDLAGNSILAGYTESVDFTGAGNAYAGGPVDAFVLKVSATGELLWMTYLGGSEADYGKAISVDDAGSAVVAGYTRSADFAGRINEYYGDLDAFAVKVDSSGAVVWMSYLGGSADDWLNDLASDASGYSLLAGVTISRDFAGRLNQPAGGGGDAYLLRLSPEGAVQWMTYLGGGGWDSSRGVAVDAAGHAFVSGRTGSTDFVGRSNDFLGGDYDAFVLKVNPAGSLQWMQYIGGSAWDSGAGLVVNGAGDVLVAGYTLSTDCAGALNANHGDVDGYVFKFSTTGVLRWMTYVGGTAGDSCAGIALDSAGNSLMTGRTASSDFEGHTNTYRGGSVDAFVVKVDAVGGLMWTTFLGGRNGDYGRGIAIDAEDNAYVAGFTSSPDFDGRGNTAYGSEDVFAAKVVAHHGPGLAVVASCPGGGAIQIEWRRATPDGRAALVFAPSRGVFSVPGGNPCAGTPLGLSGAGARLVFEGAAGANGGRTLNSNAAPSACGGYLQLIDLATCTTSNVVRIE